MLGHFEQMRWHRSDQFRQGRAVTAIRLDHSPDATQDGVDARGEAVVLGQGIALSIITSTLCCSMPVSASRRTRRYEVFLLYCRSFRTRLTHFFRSSRLPEALSNLTVWMSVT